MDLVVNMKPKNNIKKENLEEYVQREKLLMELEHEFVCDFIKLRKDNHLT